MTSQKAGQGESIDNQAKSKPGDIVTRLVDAEDNPEQVVSILSLTSSEIRSYIDQESPDKHESEKLKILLQAAEIHESRSQGTDAKDRNKEDAAIDKAPKSTEAPAPRRTSGWRGVPDLPHRTISQALNGDRKAFKELFRHYDPTVRWAVGLRVYRWPSLVPMFEDIVQETWLELARRNFKLLRYYDKTRGGSFGRFLCIVTTRIGWRACKRHLNLTTENHLDNWGNWFFAAQRAASEPLANLDEIIRPKLSAEDLRLFEDYYIRGKSLKELGAQLGLDESTIFKKHQQLNAKIARVMKASSESPGEKEPSATPDKSKKTSA